MKKIYKLILAVVIIAGMHSCDETISEAIYDGDSATRTFLSFPALVFNLPVTIDNTGTLNITLNSSTTSSVERTFNLNLVNEVDVMVDRSHSKL